MARTTAQLVSAEIRAAEARGYNSYWHRGEHESALRVIRARTHKGQLQVYTLPDCKWHDWNVRHVLNIA